MHDLSSVAFDQLVDSLLAAQRQQQPLSSSSNTTSSTSDPGVDLVRDPDRVSAWRSERSKRSGL